MVEFPASHVEFSGGVPSRELTYPPKNGILKMIFLFPRWDMLIPWRVDFVSFWVCQAECVICLGVRDEVQPNRNCLLWGKTARFPQEGGGFSG